MLIKSRREAPNKASRRRIGAAYAESFELCKRTYYTTERGKRWIAAHRRAKHILVVRRHVAKGRYRVICGTIPGAAKKRPEAIGKKPR